MHYRYYLDRNNFFQLDGLQYVGRLIIFYTLGFNIFY